MLQMTNASKTFNRGTALATTAVKNVTLRFDHGSWTNLVGPNGSGKTTCLKLISGEHRPDTGTIEIDGQDVTNWSLTRRASFVAQVFQDPSMGTASSLTIEENLVVATLSGHWALGFGVSRQKRDLFRHRLATLGLGLENRLSERVDLLSGGERQAISVLMPMLRNPPAQLLLLDEHVSSLAPDLAAKVLDITQKLVAEARVTTIAVTHRISDALKYGDRLLMIHRGTIVMDLRGEDKRRATVEDVLSRFDDASGQEGFRDGLL